MEGGVKGSYHYRRKEHGHQGTSLIPKGVRRGRRTITRETRVLPESDLGIDRYRDLQHPANLPEGDRCGNCF